CDQEDVRQAFLKLAKRFHPDSASPEADSIKFNLIEEAYRKLNNKFAQTRLRGNEDNSDFNCNKNKAVKEFDIKHTAPQHRQYLSYGGYGYGPPQKREKQFMKHRADVAINNIYNHRVSKLSKYVDEVMVVKDKKESKKIKISSEIDRLVEDLIQESMAKGDFDHLSGKGKPLPYKNTNPYVDFVTQKMNEVLIENGFTPEWITLQKEIREELHILRESLFSDRTYFGTFPLFDDEIIEWTKLVARHNDLGFGPSGLSLIGPDGEPYRALVLTWTVVVPKLDRGASTGVYLSTHSGCIPTPLPKCKGKV
ncbi:unnamed protein product, partial [Timema podura]|nr:unnamed protein product [Timema podura]